MHEKKKCLSYNECIALSRCHVNRLDHVLRASILKLAFVDAGIDVGTIVVAALGFSTSAKIEHARLEVLDDVSLHATDVPDFHRAVDRAAEQSIFDNLSNERDAFEEKERVSTPSDLDAVHSQGVRFQSALDHTGACVEASHDGIATASEDYERTQTEHVD